MNAYKSLRRRRRIAVIERRQEFARHFVGLPDLNADSGSCAGSDFEPPIERQQGLRRSNADSDDAMGRGVAARGRQLGRTQNRVCRYGLACARKAGAVAPVNPRKALADRIAVSQSPCEACRSGESPLCTLSSKRTKTNRSQDLCKARGGAGAACRALLGQSKTSVAPSAQRTTLSGGSLGSHVDEERSQLRYAM